MTYKVIGLSGHAGTGKDYIGTNYLKPLGFHQFSLAWHFKIGLVGKGIATYEEVFTTKPPHVRKALQEEGTEKGRMVFGDDIWCNTVYSWFRLLDESWGINKFYIPDVRFPNEVDFIKKMNGHVFRIVAPEREAKSGLTEAARQHISETALDHYNHEDFDGIINNDPFKGPGNGTLMDILYGLLKRYGYLERT